MPSDSTDAENPFDLDLSVSDTVIEMRVRSAEGISRHSLMAFFKFDGVWYCSRSERPLDEPQVSSSTSKRSLRTAIGTEFRKFLKEAGIDDNLEMIPYESFRKSRMEDEK